MPAKGNEDVEGQERQQVRLDTEEEEEEEKEGGGGGGELDNKENDKEGGIEIVQKNLLPNKQEKKIRQKGSNILRQMQDYFEDPNKSKATTMHTDNRRKTRR